MAVKVGSARHDENDNLRGGKAGDQTGIEVSTQNWYLHKKGWVVIRPKDAKVRELVAQDMEYACENPNIGYDQSQNYTLYNEAKKYGFNCSMVKTPCETDCSRTVRVCLAYAGIHVPVFYTGNEVEVLKATGKFEILTSPKYTESSDYLLRGDILCTKVTGHTVVVLTDGAKAKTDPVSTYSFKVETVKEGRTGASVKLCQKLLKVAGCKGKDGKVLKLDGDCGSNTVYAINCYQEKMRKKGIELGNNGQNDGICGRKCWQSLLGL